MRAPNRPVRDKVLNVSKVASISSTGAPAPGQFRSYTTGSFQACRSERERVDLTGLRVPVPVVQGTVHALRRVMTLNFRAMGAMARRHTT